MEEKSEESSKGAFSCQVQWEEKEAGEEDFEDLHRAIESNDPALRSFNGQQQEGGSSTSEEDEDDEIDERDEGRRFLSLAQRNRADDLREMLDKDKDLVNFRDEDGYTALHRAAYSNSVESAKQLISSGADLDALTEDGWKVFPMCVYKCTRLQRSLSSSRTPLHSACRWNAHGCVDLLLSHGSDPNCVSTGGQTPLHLAAFHGKARETLQLLFLHPGLKASVKNAQGDTAEDIARRNGNCSAYFDLLRDPLTKSTE